MQIMINIGDLIKTKNDKIFKIKNDFVLIKKETICKVVQVCDDYILVKVDNNCTNNVFDYYITEIVKI